MILQSILQHKRKEIEVRKETVSISQLKSRCCRTEGTSLADALKRPGVSLIAEVKKASPSAGIIRNDFNPVEIALDYQQGGAAAISVLTDERFFQGADAYLTAVKQAVVLPVLRKDFIIDEYQLYEAKAIGADAVLLIAACLSPADMEQLLKIADSIGLEALVEIHSVPEWHQVKHLPIALVGVNNRNLQTFEVHLENSLLVKRELPDTVVTVSESGIHTHDDVRCVAQAGFDAILVGEELMRAPSVTACISSLLKGDTA